MGLQKLFYLQVLLNSYLLFVFCPTEILSAPSEWCRLTPEKYTIADTQECQKYYECLGVTLTEKSCQGLLKYSKESNQCEDRKEVDCSGRVFSNQSLMNPQDCQGENEFLCKYGKECISNEQVCDGYFNCLDASDEHDCEIQNRPKLLVAFDNTIKTMIFNSTGSDIFVTYTIPLVTSISAIVYNPMNHTVILSDLVTKNIYEFDLTKKSTRLLYSNFNSDIIGMDIDLLSENLYWIDVDQNVHIMSLRSSARRLLNPFPKLTKFTDIIVVPEIRSIFVSRISDQDQKGYIYQMPMGCSNYTLFKAFSSEEPSCLFYDKESKLILWVDKYGKRVEVLNLNGTGTSVSESQPSSPTSVIRQGNQIFWTNMNSSEVKVVTIGAPYSEHRLSFTKSSNTNGHTILAVIDKDVMSFWEELKNTHECSPGNSICSHICIPSGEGLMGECKCPDNLKLDDDGINCIPSAPCGSDKFTCKNWDCINPAFVCNGKDECGDNSDEVYCSPCPEQGYIRCAINGICIPVSWVCDGDDDCYGGQDEVNCPESSTPCKTGELRCEKFGRCIQKRSLCDGEADCGISDNSDERECDPVCQSRGKIKCPSLSSSKCINANTLCDNDIDCPDGSDERNCTNSDQFRCASGDLISRSFVCDGDYDCKDRSDEEKCRIKLKDECSLDSIRCNATSICFPMSWICDRKETCPGGQDELNCPCGTDQFRCEKSGHCIPITFKCDNDNDCGSDDNSDERGCDQNCDSEEGCINSHTHCGTDEFRCEKSGNCIPIAFKCDNDNDCGTNDNSDERGCSSSICDGEKDKFKCSSSDDCISNSWVCDGENDCTDGSDEVNCLRG